MTSMSLSAYELERLENIRRNEEVLADLGLGGSGSGLGLGGDVPTTKAKRRKAPAQQEQREPQRRSHR